MLLPCRLDLLEAFAKNDRSLVLNLLCNSDIDFGKPIDNHGNTFLHRAAQCIYGRICEMVINYSSRPVDVNAKNHDGVTPLHMAALSDSETCTMFLKYEADVNSCTNYGYTPLQYAAKSGCYKACRLLSKIERVNGKGRTSYHLNEKLNLNLQNYYKETALHLVINTRNAVIMHSKRKWPFNRCTDRYTKIIKFLLNKGADTNLPNCDGDTPLHLAAKYEMEYIVKLLLHYNADVNIINAKDETAVNSVKNNKYPHVQALLEDSKFYSRGNSNINTLNYLSIKICLQELRTQIGSCEKLFLKTELRFEKKSLGLSCHTKASAYLCYSLCILFIQSINVS